MDLLLPGSVEGLARALESYRPDLVIVFGFAWRLPRSVLDIPRHGVINVHVSMLPKYRGPAPLLWAIRNGDRTGGVTVHRMDEEFDTGNVLAQQDGVPLADDITWSNYCADAMPVTYALLRTALARVVAGNPGDPQEHATASYAGFMEEDFARIRWSDDARAIHDQVRTHRFMRSPEHPVAEVDGARLVVKRTSLEPAEGTRVVCGDGEPLWITESREVTPVP
ncbi:methionyl-tRNA formyltransferase [Nocardiopsis sp. NPDC006938]|uniref:methionyl-tRNA formyltransferase n=1 Tax=Nocardiopsis sp. NPDC006938 TaxID=3364337 RepID=UPI0036BF3C27